METFSALLALCAGNSPVPMNSPHKGQWRGALIFSFICVWINDWVNNREAGDLRRHRGHYDVNAMLITMMTSWHNAFYITDPLSGNLPVNAGFPSQRASSFRCRRLKQTVEIRWFEMSRHSCDATTIMNFFPSSKLSDEWVVISYRKSWDMIIWFQTKFCF